MYNNVNRKNGYMGIKVKFHKTSLFLSSFLPYLEEREGKKIKKRAGRFTIAAEKKATPKLSSDDSHRDFSLSDVVKPRFVQIFG